MMLKSSSTPLLGSLLSSFQESPNSHHHQSEIYGATPKNPSSSSVHQSCSKLACSTTNGVSQNITRSALQSPSVVEIKGSSGTTENGFRRVQSEGNLGEMASASYDEFSFSNLYSKKFARKPNCSTLEAIPSFSLHYVGTPFEDYYSDEEEEEEEEDEEVEAQENVDVNACKAENFIFEDARTQVSAYSSMGFESEGKMYLATGLGFPRIAFVDGGIGGGGGVGGGGTLRPVDFSRDGGESGGLGIEEHYKSMLEENPGNPLFLRNYAQYLYHKRGDLEGAEQYYSRAILADPRDGDILCQYAKLIWELHHDKDRAASYFERALQASSEDSHIHAAYASFLWDSEDEEYGDEDEENAVANSHLGSPLFHHGVMAA